MVEKQQIDIGPRFYLLFAMFTLLLFPVHEFGHYITYRLSGVHLQMTLNTASPNDQSLRKPIPELAGPFVNLAVALGATLAYHLFRQRLRWLAALGLASAMFRLVIYCLILGVGLFTGSGLSLGNDEPIAARLWGLPSVSLVGVLAVPFAVVVWSIARTFRAGRFQTGLHLLGLGFVTLCLGILVGRVIDPWMFPNRYQ